MVESEQARNGEPRSPEVIDTAEPPTSLVLADADPQRGRMGRWWKRVLGAGSQGTSGLVFPGAGRLGKLEERQGVLERDLSEKLEASEARILDRVEERLEKWVAEQDERIAQEVEERVAREVSGLRARIAWVTALAAAGAVIGSIALLSELGVVSL
ncbi:MAG: hypothetical protein AAEJ53_04590 [Myxococcota bacterium]